MSTNFTALSALLNQWATPLVVLALTINVTAERIHPASAVTPYGDADTPMTLFHTGATDAASISEAAELFVPAVAVVRTPAWVRFSSTAGAT